MKNYILIGILFLMSSCGKDGEGTVSFGSNDDLLNCIHEAYVFVDGSEIGIIPGYCDTIIDCSNENTLNYTIKEGYHAYKIVVENRQGGACYSEISGEFKIDSDECIRIYFDAVDDIIRAISTQL